MGVARFLGGAITSVALLGKTIVEPLTTPRDILNNSLAGDLTHVLAVSGSLLPACCAAVALAGSAAIAIPAIIGLGVLHAASAATSLNSNSVMSEKRNAYDQTEGSHFAKSRASVKAGYVASAKDNFQIGSDIVDGTVKNVGKAVKNATGLEWPRFGVVSDTKNSIVSPAKVSSPTNKVNSCFSVSNEVQPGASDPT